MASSVDGHIALASDESDNDRRSYGFTSDADYQHLCQVINTCDAIIAGANTVRASSKLIDRQNQHGRYPLWVVLTTRGIVDANPFWQMAGQRWLVSPQHTAIDDRARYLSYGTDDPAQFVVDRLRDHGAQKVLLFGGGIVNRLFYLQRLVDELILTVCPLIVARTGAPQLVAPSLPNWLALRLLTVRRVDNHLFLHYRIDACD